MKFTLMINNLNKSKHYRVGCNKKFSLKPFGHWIAKYL